MPGFQVAVFLAAGDQHQRAVDRHHLIQEDRDVHGARLRHPVIAPPGAVVLVPLPDIAGEGRLRVDLVLVHVQLLAEQLLDRLDHARVAAQQAEGFVVQMRGEGGAGRAGLLPPDLRAVGVVDALGLRAQHGDLLRAEGLRQEKPAFFVELPDLVGVQLHDGSSRARGAR